MQSQIQKKPKQTTVIIPLSDVHLESYLPNERALLLKELNDKIELLHQDNFKTIIILAGDIGEGLMGLEFAKKINSEVIYVAGNHEFYNHDYYEVIEKLTSKAKGSNVHFLNNNQINLYGINFIGTPLFTSYGEDETIMAYAQGFMNDYSKIKAAKWYSKENAAQIKKFTSQLKGNSILTDIDSNPFNPYIAKSIFDESIKFINQALSNVDKKDFNVLVTHHAPFYDSMHYTNGFNVNDADPSVFFKDKAELKDFFLNDCQNDIVPKNENILHVNCYASDISKYINQEYLSKVTLFVHGHIHHSLNYITNHKGITVTNPKGYKWQNRQFFFTEILADKNFYHSIFLKASIELCETIKDFFLQVFTNHLHKKDTTEPIRKCNQYISRATSSTINSYSVLCNSTEDFHNLVEGLYEAFIQDTMTHNQVLEIINTFPYEIIKQTYKV